MNTHNFIQLATNVINLMSKKEVFVSKKRRYLTTHYLVTYMIKKYPCFHMPQ